MSALRVGATLREVPELPGTWSVWSQSGEAAGAYFIVPADDAARSLGVKFASIKVTQKKAEPKPVITLLSASKDGAA